MTARPGRLMRRLLAPIDRPMMIAPLVLCALAAWDMRLPSSMNLLMFVCIMILFLVMALDWSVRLVARLVFSYRARGLTPFRLTGWRRWAIAPAAIVAILMMAWTQLPLLIGFQVSRGDLARTAQAVVGQQQVEFPSRHGLYEIFRAERMGDGVLLFTLDGTYWAAGFGYLPESGSIAADKPIIVSPLSDGWFTWYAAGRSMWPPA